MNKNIFVVYPSGKLGDLIWHVPFIEHISNITDKKVVLITRKSTSAQELLCNEHFIQSIHYIEFKKGFYSYLKEIIIMSNLMRKLNAEQVWILDKNSRPAIAAKFANVNKIYGFGFGNQKIWITNKNKLQKKDLNSHYIERAKKFFKLINHPIEYHFTNLTVRKKLFKQFELLTKNNSKIIAYGVDSSEMWRSWPREYFADLINKIDQNYQCIHILIAGPWNSHVAEEIIKKVNNKSTYNYSDLSLSNVAALLKLSEIFVGNDSGILNLSAAVGTRSLGIFGATKSFNYSKNIIPIISKDGEISKITDRLLDDYGKTIKNPDLAKRVNVEDVFSEFKKIIF